MISKIKFLVLLFPADPFILLLQFASPPFILLSIDFVKYHFKALVQYIRRRIYWIYRYGEATTKEQILICSNHL